MGTNAYEQGAFFSGVNSMGLRFVAFRGQKLEVFVGVLYPLQV